MGLLKMIAGAAGGAVGGMPRWLLYVIAALALVGAGVGAWTAYATGQRLDECHAAGDKLQKRLATAQKTIADLQADKAALETSIASQNQKIERMRADSARANQDASEAAGAHRTPPSRDVPQHVDPAAVNAQVRKRIEELSQ